MSGPGLHAARALLADPPNEGTDACGGSHRKSTPSDNADGRAALVGASQPCAKGSKGRQGKQGDGYARRHP